MIRNHFCKRRRSKDSTHFSIVKNWIQIHSTNAIELVPIIMIRWYRMCLQKLFDVFFLHFDEQLNLNMISVEFHSNGKKNKTRAIDGCFSLSVAKTIYLFHSTDVLANKTYEHWYCVVEHYHITYVVVTYVYGNILEQKTEICVYTMHWNSTHTAAPLPSHIDMVIMYFLQMRWIITVQYMSSKPRGFTWLKIHAKIQYFAIYRNCHHYTKVQVFPCHFRWYLKKSVGFVFGWNPLVQISCYVCMPNRFRKSIVVRNENRIVFPLFNCTALVISHSHSHTYSHSQFYSHSHFRSHFLVCRVYLPQRQAHSETHITYSYITLVHRINMVHLLFFPSSSFFRSSNRKIKRIFTVAHKL